MWFNNRAAQISQNFTISRQNVTQGIMEDIISGKNSGYFPVFLEKLEAVQDAESYKELLITANAEEFNIILDDAIVDILFLEAPAIEV